MKWRSEPGWDQAFTIPSKGTPLHEFLINLYQLQSNPKMMSFISDGKKIVGRNPKYSQ